MMMEADAHGGGNAATVDATPQWCAFRLERKGGSRRRQRLKSGERERGAVDATVVRLRLTVELAVRDCAARVWVYSRSGEWGMAIRKKAHLLKHHLNLARRQNYCGSRAYPAHVDLMSWE
ncbi:hypothetical protein RHGRI_035938 [Rhododendron griersonianum]|uniref:Uncharacterized protein n=1 Tax=Rhododendron griersonianum TaxID=479676 RepID=A0AAV6HP39_9ERIC|nr:hypothetical protein RHGRI_035938 [Rhododendron griersonianum]